jgi:hypothetical protein
LAFIATANIEAAIYMPEKVRGAVKPRTGTNEIATHKPFRCVVAIGGAGVRGKVVVPVGAFGFGSNVDNDLSLNLGSVHREANFNKSNSENKTFESIHDSSSQSSGAKGRIPLGEGFNVRPSDYTSIPGSGIRISGVTTCADPGNIGA